MRDFLFFFLVPPKFIYKMSVARDVEQKPVLSYPVRHPWKQSFVVVK